MSEMLRIVARAICDAVRRDCLDVGVKLPKWDDEVGDNGTWIAAARAALAAHDGVRLHDDRPEPTEWR